jgi:hypothetical protein
MAIRQCHDLICNRCINIMFRAVSLQKCADQNIARASALPCCRRPFR